jgi:hypothetical protein
MMIFVIEVKVPARTAQSLYSDCAMRKTLKISRLTSSSGKRFFQTGSGIQPASSSIGTDGSFPEGKTDGE